MKRSLILLALMAASVTACARESAPPATTTAAKPATAPGAAAGAGPSAPTAQPQNEPQIPAAAAEPEAADQDQPPGAASLERLAALPPQQQLPEGRWKVGQNYDPIVPAQPVEVPAGKVEVLEVFWYGCSHCYALEPNVEGWLKAKSDYIQFVRVPIMWGPVHRAHARLYYTLQALGRLDLHEKVFDTIHLQNNPLVGASEEQTLMLQSAFAQANGIDAAKFQQAYKSPAVEANLRHAQEVMQHYRVNGVPFLAINGKYTSDIDKAGGAENLFVLISDLAASEHHH